MKTSELLLSILIRDELAAVEYFSKICVNEQKTLVKYGFVKDSISINFFTYGIVKNEILKLSEKLDLLLNTDENLDALHEYLSQIKEPYSINFSPYIKINEEPIMHAFRISINHAGI